ncbi:MAG: RICIN domain-containing protein [Minicystis sp.]
MNSETLPYSKIMPVVFYRIKSVLSGLFVCPSGKSSGSGLVQKPDPSNGTDQTFWWGFSHEKGPDGTFDGGSTYRIFNAYSGFSAAAKDNKPSNGTHLLQHQWEHDDEKQLWVWVTPLRIIGSYTNQTYVWDVTHGSTSSGAHIELYTQRDGSENQQWILVPVAK